MIKQFDDKTAYEAYTPSTDQSDVMHVKSTNEIHPHGVNVVTDSPDVGDLLYLDGNNEKVWIKGESDENTINKSLIPSDWTLVGAVFRREGKQVRIVNKDYEDHVQSQISPFQITEITSTDVTISLWGNDAKQHDVKVTLSAAEISAATAQEINDAVVAAQIDDQDWWAWLADDGQSIYVQCDRISVWQQYQCRMVGGRILSVIQESDYPASYYVWLKNGRRTQTQGVLSQSVALNWWATRGRTPTTDEDEMKDNDPVNRDSFENSDYCKTIREKYGTYESYLWDGLGVAYPQKYGTFGLTDAKTTCNAHWDIMVKLKDGTVIPKYEAIHYAHSISYPNADLGEGAFYVPSIHDAVYFCDENVRSLVSASLVKAGAGEFRTQYVSRWLCERVNAGGFRFFYGSYGALNGLIAYTRFRVQAVALLNIE